MSDDTEWQTMQLTPTHRISFSNQKAYEVYYEKHRAEIENFQRMKRLEESRNVVENCECILALKISLQNLFLFLVYSPSHDQEIINRTIWVSFFAILILLFCLQLQKMKNADKKKRQRINPASRFSRLSTIQNFNSQLQIDDSGNSLDQVPASAPSETVINLEVPDSNSDAIIANQTFDYYEPAVFCQTFDDPTPCYEAPPSYDDCVQPDS